MATKTTTNMQDQDRPKSRYLYHTDQNKIGRMLALLFTQYSGKDKRGDAQVRFEVYAPEAALVDGAPGTTFISRIYIQRDVDKDETLAGRPYLKVEELRMNALSDRFELRALPFLDVQAIVISAFEYDAKGRPAKVESKLLTFDQLPEYAHNTYQFLVSP